MSGHSKFANIKHKRKNESAAKGPKFLPFWEGKLPLRREGLIRINASSFPQVVARSKGQQHAQQYHWTRHQRRGRRRCGNVNYEYVTYKRLRPQRHRHRQFDALTDNKNHCGRQCKGAPLPRTAWKHQDTRYVSFMFDKGDGSSSTKGRCEMEADDLMMMALDAGAEDFGEEGEQLWGESPYGSR